jgi:HlyD family secretion protein
MRKALVIGLAAIIGSIALVSLAVRPAGLAVLGGSAASPAGEGAASRTLLGTIEAREVDVAPEIGGRLVQVAVQEGQPVKKGDLLATLDDEEVKLQIARLEARLAAARASIVDLQAPARDSAISQQRSRTREAQVALDEASAQLARATSLRSQGAGSAVDVDQAEFAVRAARQRVETERKAMAALQSGARPTEVITAEAHAEEQAREVDLAKLTLRRTRLLAPMDGVVLQRHRDAGEMVAAATPIVTLINTGDMWVELLADPRIHADVRVGQPAEVRAEASPGTPVAGRVSFVADRHSFAPRAAQTRDDRALLTFRVKVQIEEPSPLLKPGMFAEVVLKPTAAASQ